MGDRPRPDEVRQERAGRSRSGRSRGQRARYEAAFARFCSVFPDTFYIAERGRHYFDTPRTTAAISAPASTT